MEEGGVGQGEDASIAKDILRDTWRKMVESEERLRLFKKMVGLGLQVRELEHVGEELHSKFRSEVMKGGEVK